MRTSNFSDLLVPGINKILLMWAKKRPITCTQWLRVESSDRSYEDDLVMAGVGSVPQKDEGDPIAFSDFMNGDTRRFTHDEWALGFAVTEIMREDNQYKKETELFTEALYKSMRNRVEVQGYGVLNNGFGTTMTTWDGLSLFNTAHTLVRGGTQANRPTVEADLDVSSLQAAIETCRNWTDDEGQYVDIEPRKILVNTNGRWMCREILQSPKKPHTLNNEINAILEDDLSYMDTPFLTDTDAWFLLTDPSDHQLKLFWRRKPRLKSWDDEDTGNANFAISSRFSVGATHHLGAYGTQGA